MADTDLQAETPKTTGVTGDTLLFGALTGTGEAVADTITVSAFSASGIIRELLTANRTYYMRTDGSDSNDGLADTAGGAFLTLQGAFTTIANTVDTGGNNIVVWMAAGTYAADTRLFKMPTGGGRILIIGAGAAASDAVLEGGGSFGTFALSTVGDLVLANLQIESAGGNAVVVDTGGARIGIDNSASTLAEFDIVAAYDGVDFALTTQSHMFVTNSAALYTLGTYSISDDAGTAHMEAAISATIGTYASDVAISGTPSFGTAFALAYAGGIIDAFVTYSGSGATGKRYLIGNGGINTYGGGANYFPGDVAGTSDETWQYT